MLRRASIARNFPVLEKVAGGRRNAERGQDKRAIGVVLLEWSLMVAGYYILYLSVNGIFTMMDPVKKDRGAGVQVLKAHVDSTCTSRMSTNLTTSLLFYTHHRPKRPWGKKRTVLRLRDWIFRLMSGSLPTRSWTQSSWRVGSILSAG